jgi:hypothetical protein
MITPSDSASSPADYASVAVQPVNIQAPQADLSGEFGAANAAAGSGVLYPQSERQAETGRLLASPQGYGAFSILGGYSGGGGEDWPSDASP